MNYTKGPWTLEVNPFPLPRSQGSFVGHIRVNNDTIALLVCNPPTMDANAHLIAAAPEMYEALHSAINGIETVQVASGYTGEAGFEALRLIRAALAKAEEI